MAKGKLNVESLEEELDRVNRASRFRNSLKSTIFGLIVVAALMVLIATIWMPVLRIYGDSMDPSLKEKDLVLSVKKKDYDRGDIVAFTMATSF